MRLTDMYLQKLAFHQARAISMIYVCKSLFYRKFYENKIIYGIINTLSKNIAPSDRASHSLFYIFSLPGLRLLLTKAICIYVWE